MLTSLICAIIAKKLGAAYCAGCDIDEVAVRTEKENAVRNNCDIDFYSNELSVEIDAYQEKDYTEVDNKIERLRLKPRDRTVLDCYMAGMTCNEIADFLDISRITVWRRRTRAQVKYKTLFN